MLELLAILTSLAVYAGSDARNTVTFGMLFIALYVFLLVLDWQIRSFKGIEGSRVRYPIWILLLGCVIAVIFDNLYTKEVIDFVVSRTGTKGVYERVAFTSIAFVGFILSQCLFIFLGMVVESLVSRVRDHYSFLKEMEHRRNSLR